LLPCGAKDTL